MLPPCSLHAPRAPTPGLLPAAAHTHAPAELPFLFLYPPIAPRQQRAFLVPWSSSFPRAQAHAQSPPSHPALYSDSHQGTHMGGAFPPLSLQPFSQAHTGCLSRSPHAHMPPALPPRPLQRLSHSQTLPPLSPRCLLRANTHAHTQTLSNSTLPGSPWQFLPPQEPALVLCFTE